MLSRSSWRENTLDLFRHTLLFIFYRWEFWEVSWGFLRIKFYFFISLYSPYFWVWTFIVWIELELELQDADEGFANKERGRGGPFVHKIEIVVKLTIVMWI
ncbi:hypothetical protein EYC80_009436 [Monilinia laxa]|uniref:Uncharacterized protein n=1 Tax=Monilinia laxa TaxID=61186 RepID=A0A5N6JXX6_MONLA|nr:hypothetical protein EYC80_009436 [Monilinia laxa]